MKQELFSSYVAGFLDADGSIYVRLKPNKTYRFGFQVAPYIVFFQSKSGERFIKEIHRKLGLGYIRYRKDGIIEYTIGDRPSIRKLIQRVSPFLICKKKQAQLMLAILNFSESVKTARNFLTLATLIDRFEKLNYSKKRTIHAQVVRNYLIQQGKLTP